MVGSANHSLYAAAFVSPATLDSTVQITDPLNSCYMSMSELVLTWSDQPGGYLLPKVLSQHRNIRNKKTR